MPLRIALVDDDADYARLLAHRLGSVGGVQTHHYASGTAAVDALRDRGTAFADLVFLDLVMPGQDGLATLQKMNGLAPDLPVVMVSAKSEVRTAVEAVRLGAYDYLTKGQDDLVRITGIAERVAERVALHREVETLRQRVTTPAGFPELLGESGAMSHVYRMVKKATRGDINVAIQGESGTGKELVAEAIHHNSARADEPFVIVNCAAIPRELMESEFFGHEKGSFTGAFERKIGTFERADRGTLFLDEIGELDLDLQAKLLRVLQNGRLTRVGGNETIEVDVRVISATNRDILEMVREGTFREDLYYRLFSFPIHLPPLRDRDQDALLLANHFLARFQERHEAFDEKYLTSTVQRAILRYAWPGNVRELKNAIERAALVSDEDGITTEDLMLAQQPLSGDTEVLTAEPATPRGKLFAAEDPDEILPIEELKRLAVEHALQVCKGNIEKTAQKLGVTRSTIYRLMKKFDIDQVA
ncbi:MAG: sigma-54 dependent transcriptional regulator [Bacteroidota bacterium]